MKWFYRDCGFRARVSLPIIGKLLLCALAAVVFVPRLTRAQETDTVSQVTSYLYYDAAGEDTNSPVTSGVVSYLYSDAINSDTNSAVASPVMSFLYYDAPGVDVNSAVLSRVVSYLYYDWLGDENLTFQNSPLVSYYYNVGPAGSGVAIYGTVFDAAGGPVSGATVSASVLGTVQTTTQTSVDGSYALVALPPGVYVLRASLANYALSARVLTVNAGSAQQNFQLSQLGAAPAVAQTTRQPAAAFTQPPAGPMGSTLKVFDGTSFVAINANNAPAPSRITIVLTHGWTRDPLCGLSGGIAGWPAVMSAALRVGLPANKANIVGWDWFGAANACPLPPEENTPSQGVALGVALQAALGGGYAQPVHFMGHSLGALVNAAAANYLHGDVTAQQAVSPTPWPAGQTHMTLFDQAEVSRVAGVQVLFDGLTVVLGNPLGALKYAAGVLQGWKPSMPVHSAWADNYISYFGFYLPNTFNVALQKAEGIARLRAASESSDPLVVAGKIIEYAHGYPMVWYSASIGTPTDTPLGFQQSWEYDLEMGLPVSTFPSSLLQLGDAYHQEPSASDPLTLEPLPPEDIFQALVPVLGNKADLVVQGAVGVVHLAHDVVVDVENGVHAAGEWISQGASYVAGVAQRDGQAVVNLFNSAVLHLTFHSAPPAPGPHRLDWHGETNAPMAWLPVFIPSNIVAMAFDFSVSGNPFDDVMVCGLSTSNLFSLEAKYIPTNTYSTSRLIDVSPWAGATNELFFGLMGGTSTNATLEVENIRFFALQAPRLDIALAGSLFVLSWPDSAAGYVVQSTATLGPANWQDVTNMPVLLSGQYALTNAVGSGSGYYRLRKQ